MSNVEYSARVGSCCVTRSAIRAVAYNIQNFFLNFFCVKLLSARVGSYNCCVTRSAIRAVAYNIQNFFLFFLCVKLLSARVLRDPVGDRRRRIQHPKLCTSA
ncbi:hypothetical protein B0H21DRAFT_740804 [Amylocystis lapponica]|nr:hypothetical protein B0H21DRAFT_740804 [Amylocystis lapponica]